MKVYATTETIRSPMVLDRGLGVGAGSTGWAGVTLIGIPNNTDRSARSASPLPRRGEVPLPDAFSCIAGRRLLRFILRLYRTYASAQPASTIAAPISCPATSQCASIRAYRSRPASTHETVRWPISSASHKAAFCPHLISSPWSGRDTSADFPEHRCLQAECAGRESRWCRRQ